MFILPQIRAKLLYLHTYRQRHITQRNDLAFYKLLFVLKHYRLHFHEARHYS